MGQSTIAIEIERMPHADGLSLPAYQTTGAAGMDLLAAVDAGEPMRLKPMGRAMIPTGLKLSIPEGFEGQVRPRSGLAAKLGLTVLNAPGTIDSDYRGEVMVILINLSDETHEIGRGERIAQLVIAPVTRGALIETRELNATSRGVGGFGSTGKA